MYHMTEHIMDEAFFISSVITLAIFYTYFDQKMLKIARMVFHTEHFKKWAEQLPLSAEGHYCKCGCYEKSVVMTVIKLHMLYVQ